jgi:hypothetical protein
LALVALAAFGGVGAATSTAASPAPALDIELAFDTTGSMAPSLAVARRNADRILGGVRAIVPNARFGVVSFRDHGNPGGEYQTLQPLTASSAAIREAIRRLKSVHNTSPGNLAVESYNLAFHRSYADNALGWRPDARKIVLVIGDAEPYGVGSAGFGGCSDGHVDPDGLNTKTELAGMRASGRTLVMIREVSQYTTATLQCYQSLAAGAFPGGDARDGNSTDIVTPLVDLVHRALAPLTLSAALPIVLPGEVSTVTATLRNPNAFPLEVTNLTIIVPGAFANVVANPAPAGEDGGHLTWDAPQTLQPGSRTEIQLTLTAAQATSRATISATGAFQLGTGPAVTTDAQVSLFVTRRLTVAARATARGVKLAGGATIVIPAAARTAAAASGAQRQGQFSLTSGRKAAILLRPYAFRLSVAGGGVTAAFKVRIARSGKAGCRVGSRGVLTVRDPSFGTTGAPWARLVLPRACRPPVTQWQLPAGGIRALASG